MSHYYRLIKQFAMLVAQVTNTVNKSYPAIGLFRAAPFHDAAAIYLAVAENALAGFQLWW